MGLHWISPKEVDVRTYFVNSLHRLLTSRLTGGTVDKLPDVVLLEIFDFYLATRKQVEAWHTLVHVCRKWRNVVLGSPLRLRLRICCRARTPVRKMLDIWPPLPIAVYHRENQRCRDDNIIAALEHNDRISLIDLWGVPSSQSENVMEAMRQPFPTLGFLELGFEDETLPVQPDSFLGGSAPNLHTLTLHRIPFPGLPKLLLSATHLVTLELQNIPHSGYFSPGVIVTSLSVLIRLKFFVIQFESPQSRPDRRRPPPQTRTLLPFLTSLQFQGVSEYLEELVGRIDVPLLNNLWITFFHQLIFDTPQLTQLISRTPNVNALDNAYVHFSDKLAWVSFPPKSLGGIELELGILCRQPDWQLSSLAQLCSSSLPQSLTSAVEHLYIINEDGSELPWQDDIENSQWLELLHPFTAVKNSYIPLDFTPRIAPALKELVGERVTEVLPALQTLFLEEPHQSGPAIEHFVAARQLAGYPVAVSQLR